MRYLSLDVDALIRDFRVRVLPPDAFGGYVALLFEAAIADGRLPTDDDQLAVLSRLGSKSWAVHKNSILGLALIDGETVTFPQVTEAVDNWVAKRKVNARNATARWSGSTYRSKDEEKGSGVQKVDKTVDKPQDQSGGSQERKVEPKGDATALRPESEGDPPVPSNGLSGDKKKDNSPVSGDRTPKYSKEFESFWEGYRKLGGSTEMPKAKSFASWQSAKRRASVEEIMAGLKRYDDWLREESRRAKDKGTRSPRDFVPMPTTWLNQSRWDSERKGEKAKTVIPEPVCGVDFNWRDISDGEGQAKTGKVKMIDGVFTDEPFRIADWYREKGFPEEAKIYED